jgi:hypothetical protein
MTMVIVDDRLSKLFKIDEATLQRMTDLITNTSPPVTVPDPGLLTTLRTALQKVMDYDQALDDPIGDGSGRGALSPTGDDYNALCGILQPLYDALGMTGPLSLPKPARMDG